MSYSNCEPALTFMGPLFTIIGSFVAYVAVLAWIKPNSSIVETFVMSRYPTEEKAGPILGDLGFTRELLAPAHLLMFRLLGPLIGIVFAAVGLWVTISQIHCREHFPDPRMLWGPIAWQSTHFFFVVFTGLIGVWNARQMRPILRELYVLCALLFGVAASEAAAFHVGVQANRWGAITVIAVALSGVLWLVNSKFRLCGSATKPQSSSE
jgi:hypothetical protein